MPAQFLMFLPLVRSGSRGEIEPWLAESWEHSPDYRTWTVRLRSDVRWHDGVPFTADDVEFTYRLLSHPEVLGIAPDAFDLTVHDQSTFTIPYHTGESYSSPDTVQSAVSAGDPRFLTYHQTTGDHCKGIAWNERHPALRDPLVRRALTLAINRRELHRVIDLPDDTPVFDVIFTRRQFQNRRLPEPLAFDPDRAKALLDEAGWHDFDGDGVRENGTAVLELSTIVAATQGLDKAAVYVQSQLKQLGVRLVIQNLELGRAKERATSGDFDALFMIFQHGKRDVGHKAYFGSQSPIGYSNPDVIALLEAAESTVHPDEMDRIYQQLMPIFQEDLPATFLYPMAFKTIAHRRVRGIEGTGWGDPLWNMDRLWLEEE